MSTVEKALGILLLFNESRPAIGLSQVARLIGRDKASVLRYLNDLEKLGFLEQDPFTRAYHLGPAIARLSLIREQTYPLNQAIGNILKRLVADTGETAHLTHFSSESLSEIAIEETSFRGTRVYIDPAEPLPLHASASGIAYLSACPPERRTALLKTPLKRFTPGTLTDPRAVMACAARAAAAGYATSPGTFEADIHGIAAPVFGGSGQVVGAVAVATPQSRMTTDRQNMIADAVMNAAQQISRHYGARLQEAAE